MIEEKNEPLQLEYAKRNVSRIPQLISRVFRTAYHGFFSWITVAVLGQTILIVPEYFGFDDGRGAFATFFGGVLWAAVLVRILAETKRPIVRRGVFLALILLLPASTRVSVFVNRCAHGRSIVIYPLVPIAIGIDSRPCHNYKTFVSIWGWIGRAGATVDPVRL